MSHLDRKVDLCCTLSFTALLSWKLTAVAGLTLAQSRCQTAVAVHRFLASFF